MAGMLMPGSTVILGPSAQKIHTQHTHAYIHRYHKKPKTSESGMVASVFKPGQPRLQSELLCLRKERRKLITAQTSVRV